MRSWLQTKAGKFPKMKEKMMYRALELARKGLGRTSPNPMVGAVITNNGSIIGEGYHRFAGTPHAEIHALRQAGDNAQGATMYVTLEPCSHYGRTPPCTGAIIKAGIKKVIVAMVDPNPKVAGRGISQLKNAGIEVEAGILEAEAVRLNEVFIKYITTNYPFGALKMAMTLDGKIATVSGDARWISGPEARVFVHHLRDRYDAIMVGINTLINDDPRLTTRLANQQGKDPVRIILDSKLRISPEAKVLNTVSSAPTIVVTTPRYNPEKRSLLETKGAEVLVIEDSGDLINLNSLMKILGKREITGVLIEGGSQVAYNSLEAGIVDKLYWFIAPKLVGGQLAPGPVGGTGKLKLDQAWNIIDLNVEECGKDVLITAYPNQEGVQHCLQD